MKTFGAVLLNITLALLAGLIAPHVSLRTALSITGLFAFIGGYAMCWESWVRKP